MSQQALALLFLTCALTLSYHTVRSQEETNLADEPASTVDETVPEGSIDELIVNSANSTQEFDFFYDEGSQFVKVELDMVYSYQEYDELEQSNGVPNTRRKKRTAGIKNGAGGGRRWSNNIVPFQYARVFSSRDLTQLRAGIADWEKYTCLDFQERSSGNRIYFNNGGGCYSRVGMVGGAQTVGLAPGCRNKGIVIHEIGHALGLHHEQTRPDRDQHVRIINSNIPARVRYNFQRNSWNTILNMGIPYDYTSIMHYGKTAFSTNGRLTIQTIDPKYQNVIGNRQGLSFADIKSINIMYNCKRHISSCTKNDNDCPGQGFVGKDCKCWCPGGSLRNPTKSCTGGGTGGGGRGTTPAPVTQRPRPTTRPTTGCQDRHRSCRWWAGRGECRRYASYMQVYCKKSCNLCGGSGSGGGCRDSQYSCPRWKRNGYCRGRWATYMRSNCKASCGLCGRSDAGPCTDQNINCQSWANIGECRRNPGYMLTSCRQSCGQCNAASPLDGGRQGACVDRNDHCSYWSNAGECARNPGYMGMMCKKSCGMCNQ